MGRSLRTFRLWLWFAVVVAGLPLYMYFTLRGTAGPSLPKLGAVPDFEMTSSEDEPVTLSSLKGGVWVADFIFTTCTSSCPRLTRRMKMLQEELRTALPKSATVRLVSFTVDPENDTPERLSRYAGQWGIHRGNWVFLTGAEATVRTVVDGFKVGLTKVPAPSPSQPADIVHSNRFVLVDSEAQIRGYYDADHENEMAALVRDAKQLVRR